MRDNTIETVRCQLFFSSLLNASKQRCIQKRETCQTSKKEHFAKIVNVFQLSTISPKSYNLDTWQGSKEMPSQRLLEIRFCNTSNQGGLNENETELNRCWIFSISTFNEFYLFV